jgi:hypothetical protein
MVGRTSQRTYYKGRFFFLEKRDGNSVAAKVINGFH